VPRTTSWPIKLNSARDPDREESPKRSHRQLLKAIAATHRLSRSRGGAGYGFCHGADSLDDAAPDDVDAFLRTRTTPLEDPMSGRRFHVVATGSGSATYRRFNGTSVGTVSTETLQAILAEVLERARAAKAAWPENAGDAMFTVGLDRRFWMDHGHFANAVIAGIAHHVFDWSDGLVPDDDGILGSDTAAELISQQGAACRATVGGRPDSTSVGVPYVNADESAIVVEHDPFATDPDLVERGTRSHASTEPARR
jgi:hypothetical protein